jgi:photosystem II stability/assembly factor-like uncharacterized protein
MVVRLFFVLAVVLCVASPAGASETIAQRDDEARSIIERIKLYRERHGINGELDSRQMLERTRWGYQRWLAAEQPHATKTASGAGWVSLGPANSAGRMTALAPHPEIDGTVLAGAASGGVWKTTDHGASWRPLTDGLSDLSVGAVAYAPSNPEVVYLGTGEAGLGSFFVPGIGLLRSDDGGETWFLPQVDEIVAEQFYALAVDPRDEDHLLAATERGLFATSDGGSTWENRLQHPDLLGVTEVLRSPADPDRLWTALWCFSRCPDGLSRVMTSFDGGIVWQPATDGLPDALFDNPLANRIALTVAGSDADVLYAALNTNRITPQGPAVAVYRSDDGGLSWENTGDPGAYLLYQGWYDNAITVDPEDPDLVVAGGVWYVRSSDGGATWTTMDPISGGDWMGTETLPHVDGHAFAWQNGALWLGCDGGVWVSADGGSTWDGRNDSLVTRQFYGLAIDPIRTDRVLGGTQDNKTNLRYGAGEDDWEWVLDGDGFETAINPLSPDLVYGTIYHTLIFRSFDGGFEWENISPGTGDDRTPFATPLTMRREVPWQLFTGSTRVWRTDDGGDSWTALGTEVANGEWSPLVVRSVALTVADPDRIMIGKGGEVLTSHNGGDTWWLSPMVSNINSVAISPIDPQTALACLARTPSGEPQVMRTTDGGLSWHPADSGLPPFAVQVARWDPADPSVVYAGTDVGLYRSTDGGLGWTVVGDGLPAASVHDLAIADDGSRLVAATHGRGIWELRLSDPVGSAPVVALTGPVESILGEPVSYTATATDADGDAMDLRWLNTDGWQLSSGGSGVGSVQSSYDHVFATGGRYMVTANVVDGTGRAGFSSLVVRAFEPADACETPRVIPSDGPFPHTILTENDDATIGAQDPDVPCAEAFNDPDAGRWGSLWFEFMPQASGHYVLSTCGSKEDTVLSAWTGPACGPYEAIPEACNDDDGFTTCSGSARDSVVFLDLVAGETVRFMVGGFEDDDLGRLRITVDCTSCGPGPDPGIRIVNAAARVAGANQTSWTSDLQLVNTGDDAVTAEIHLLPRSGPAPEPIVDELAAGAARMISDVAGNILGGDGAGALRVEATENVAITSRTATETTDGTYGQGIPSAALADATPAAGAIRLPGLVSTPEFRTNIGLVNPGTTAISLVIRLYDDEGDELAEIQRTVDAGRWLQLNRVFSSAGVGTVTSGLAVLRPTSTDGEFFAYGSVVDERTGDPTYVAPTPAGKTGHTLWIPAAAHTEGVGGVPWRTDLSLANVGVPDVIAKLTFVGPDGTETSTFLHVPKGWTITYPDVVVDQLDSEGPGAIRIEADGGYLMATSRTFASTVDGTYGQGIPGVAENDAFDAGESGLLPGLRQDDDFRSNIGFVNISEAPLQVTVSARAAGGEELASRTYSLDGQSWFQANQPFPTGTAFAVFESDSADAAYLAYASVVDSATDDPTYVAAVRMADP